MEPAWPRERPDVLTESMRASVLALAPGGAAVVDLWQTVPSVGEVLKGLSARETGAGSPVEPSAPPSAPLGPVHRPDALAPGIGLDATTPADPGPEEGGPQWPEVLWGLPPVATAGGLAWNSTPPTTGNEGPPGGDGSGQQPQGRVVPPPSVDPGFGLTEQPIRAMTRGDSHEPSQAGGGAGVHEAPLVHRAVSVVGEFPGMTVATDNPVADWFPVVHDFPGPSIDRAGADSAAVPVSGLSASVAPFTSLMSAGSWGGGQGPPAEPTSLSGGAGLASAGGSPVRDFEPPAPDWGRAAGPAADLSRTNELLQQLLDEVRRGRQPFLPLGARDNPSTFSY